MNRKWATTMEENELSIPLLSRDSDNENPTAANTPSTTTNDSSHPQIAAAARAVATHAEVLSRRGSTNMESFSARRKHGRKLSKKHGSRSGSSRMESMQFATSQHQTSKASDNDNDADTYRTERIYSFDENATDDATAAFDADGGGNNAAKEKMSTGEMIKTGGVVVVTTAGIVSWLVAFVASSTFTALVSSTVASRIAGVAGGVCIVTVPLVWASEWRLARFIALRKRVYLFRDEAERTRRIVNSLTIEEEELNEEMETIKQGNVHLKEVVEEQISGNVDELVELVQENQNVLNQMEENLRRYMLQDFVRLVLRSDLDHDNIISKNEATLLEKRLSYSLNTYGIEFDVKKFHRAIRLSPSLCGVMTIVKRFLPDENGRLSSFYDDDDDDDDDVMEDDDVYDMFYLSKHEYDDDVGEDEREDKSNSSSDDSAYERGEKSSSSVDSAFANFMDFNHGEKSSSSDDSLFKRGEHSSSSDGSAYADFMEFINSPGA